MTDVPMWVQAAVNDERRKLMKNPRLEVLAERVEAKIVAIGKDPVENAALPRCCVFRGLRPCGLSS